MRSSNPGRIRKTEGKVKVLGFNLFYRVFTPPSPKGTVVCLHGGPGATHDYLLPLRDLAKSGWRVVFYDQPGMRGVRHAEELRSLHDRKRG